MEDSSSNTLQDIENLKQKISGYRDTLMALKMGPSLDDYLMMNKEFDVLKMQITYIEDLTNKLDKKQNKQNEIFEEQLKQFAIQLSLLHKTVEHLSLEIMGISNKLTIGEDGKEEIEEDSISKDNIASINEGNETNIPNTMAKRMNSLTPPDDLIPKPKVSNQPSFMQLRRLDSPLLKQKEQEKLVSNEQDEFKVNPKDLRYLKSINTLPNHTQNGRSNKSLGVIPQPIDLRKGYHFSHLTDEAEKVNEVPSTTINNNDDNSTNLQIIEPIEPTNERITSITSEANYTEPVIEEQNNNYSIQEGAIEKINSDAEFLDGDSKKQKNSFFNSIFRK